MIHSLMRSRILVLLNVPLITQLGKFGMEIRLFQSVLLIRIVQVVIMLMIMFNYVLNLVLMGNLSMVKTV